MKDYNLKCFERAGDGFDMTAEGQISVAYQHAKVSDLVPSF